MTGRHLLKRRSVNYFIKSKFFWLFIIGLIFGLCVPATLAFASSNDNSQDLSIANEDAQGTFGDIMTKEIIEYSNSTGYSPKAIEQELIEFINDEVTGFDNMSFEKFVQYEQEFIVSGNPHKSMPFVSLLAFQCYTNPNWYSQHFPSSKYSDAVEFEKAIFRSDVLWKSTADFFDILETKEPNKCFEFIKTIFPAFIQEIEKCIYIEVEKHTANQYSALPPITIKSVRDDLKTRKLNHEQGIPDTPITMQSTIYQMLQRIGYPDITESEINQYFADFRYYTETYSFTDCIDIIKNHLTLAQKNQDINRLKEGVVEFYFLFESPVQYAFYNISNPKYNAPAKGALRSDGYLNMLVDLIEILQAKKINDVANGFTYYCGSAETFIYQIFDTEDPDFYKQYFKELNDEIVPYKIDPCAKIGDEVYPILQAALDNVKDNETITLIKDISLMDSTNFKAENPTNSIFDLNGHVIEGYSDLDFMILANGNGNVLNITDSSSLQNGKVLAAESKGCLSAESGASILVSAGTYSQNIKEDGYLKEGSLQFDNPDGTFTVVTFDTYKQQLVDDLRNVLQEGDSEETLNIVNEACNDILNTPYNPSISPEENKNIVDAKLNNAIQKVLKSRIEDYNKYKEAAKSQMESLRDTQDCLITDSIIDGYIDDLNDLSFDPDFTPAENKSLIDDLVNSLEDELYDQRIDKYEQYKKEQIAYLESLIQQNDNEAIKSIFQQAILDITNLSYDKKLNLTNNENLIDSLINTAKQKAEYTLSAQTGDNSFVTISMLFILFVSSCALLIRKQLIRK